MKNQEVNPEASGASPKRKYNCIIIGAGGQGAMADAPGSGNEGKIISFAHAVKEHPGFDLEVIYDIDPMRRNHANIIWETGSHIVHLETAFLHPIIDVAIVTTPDDSHYQILKQLAEYPLKLVLCEKPITTDLQQAREIVELYKAKEIPIMVNYTRRFLPYYDHLKQYKPFYGTCMFNRGFLHTGSHAVDFFEMIGLKNYKLIEVPTEEFRVWNLTVIFEDGNVWTEQRNGEQPVWPYYDKSHWHVVNNAFKFLEGREPLKCNGEDGLRALEICFKLMGGAKQDGST